MGWNSYLVKDINDAFKLIIWHGRAWNRQDGFVLAVLSFSLIGLTYLHLSHVKSEGVTKKEVSLITS